MIRDKIRTVWDFPVKGIEFRDITTLLKDGELFRETIFEMKKATLNKEIDIVVGMEARGFLLGCPLAYELGKGFVPVRKPGKLPAETISEEYELEYGTDKLEVHKDSIVKGQKVLIVDDLLATGGTAVATAKMIEKLGGEVIGMLFLIELEELKGRDKLAEYNIESVVKY